MAQTPFSVVDCDGHIIEEGSELLEFLGEDLRQNLKSAASQRGRNTHLGAVFPSLDGMHMLEPRATSPGGRQRVNASEFRMGSAEDWLEFMDKAHIQKAVMFPSEGLSVGLIQKPRYAAMVCRGYNDYVYHKYRRISDRLRPIALIPLQDVQEAVRELRRAVLDLGLPGAMLPSRGLPLHLGHEHYWPIYEEAQRLDCTLAVHGGSNYSMGLEGFTNSAASHILHHPLPLMVAFVSFFWEGALDRFPDLRLAFMEGGTGWLVSVMDRIKREDHYAPRDSKLDVVTWLQSGRVLIGCEGSEEALDYLVKRVGVTPFAYASDYPHEVDAVAAMEEIDEVAEYPGLSETEKQAVLAANAVRFFKL